MDEKDDDGKGSLYIYIPYFIALAAPSILLMANTLYRTYYELKEDYYDMFRLSQYFFLSVYLVVWITFYITIMIDDSETVIEI